MFSEANAADNAERLEKIILEAIHSGNDGVMEFAKKHLYQWYCWELGETWGSMIENPEIEKAFESKPQPEKPSCWDDCTRLKHGTIEECQNCADRPDGYNMYKKLRPEDCLSCDKVNTEYCKTYCINILRKI